MSLYRLYIDEVGNQDLTHTDANERFLSLTGVIIESQYCIEELVPEMEEIKRRFFVVDPDIPVIFHRKEMVNKRPPFQALRDPIIEDEFNIALLTKLEEWDYTVITIVIDKLAHVKKYKVWRYHPYHFCLSVMLERYVLFLKEKKSTGDVMVEARGGSEDKELEASYTRLYDNGDNYISHETFQRYLTSSQLKVRQKTHNICGLQLADIIAHPSRREILLDHSLIDDRREVFGDRVTEILRDSKYYRDYKKGEINGYGKKLLP